jgi:hypothetical protein
MDKNEMNQVAESKANAISLIANSKCFIVITDNGEKEKNLDTRMMLNNPFTALAFLKALQSVKYAILNPQVTPPPSSIFKP